MLMRVAAIVAIGLSMIGSTRAEDATRKPIQIGPQDLRPALQTYAKLERLHVLFLSEDVQNRKTEGVSGTLTNAEALEELLRGTNLTYQPLGDGSIMILPARTEAASQSESEVMAGNAIDLAGTQSRRDQVIISAPSAQDAEQLESFRELGDVSRDEYKRLAPTLPFEKSVTIRFPGQVRYYQGRSPLGTHVQSANAEGLVVSRIFRFKQEQAESALLVHNSNTFPVFLEVDYAPAKLGDGAYFPLAPGETGLAISWAPTTCLPVFVDPIFAECSSYSITPGVAHLRVMKQWASN
jgi:secretin/TonB-like protein